MTWPRSRIRTYSPGLPVFPGDLNRFQDSIVHGSHGVKYRQYSLANRSVVSGTWTVETSIPSGPGSITESVNATKCFVFFDPPDAGSRIIGIRFKVKDGGGGTSLARFMVTRHKDDGTIATLGLITSSGAGLLEILDAPFSESEYEVERQDASRWYAELTNHGGGAALRRYYSFEIAYYRP